MTIYVCELCGEESKYSGDFKKCAICGRIACRSNCENNSNYNTEIIVDNSYIFDHDKNDFYCTECTMLVPLYANKIKACQEEIKYNFQQWKNKSLEKKTILKIENDDCIVNKILISTSKVNKEETSIEVDEDNKIFLFSKVLKEINKNLNKDSQKSTFNYVVVNINILPLLVELDTFHLDADTDNLFIKSVYRLGYLEDYEGTTILATHSSSLKINEILGIKGTAYENIKKVVKVTLKDLNKFDPFKVV
jgi:hypothetical protein